MKKVTVHTRETIGQIFNRPAPNEPSRPSPVAPLAAAVTTPAQIVESPPAKPGMMTALNGHLPLGGNSGHSPTIRLLPLKHAQPHRHMHMKPATKANQLNAQIDRFAERLAGKLGLASPADFAHPSQTTQEDVLVVGRIVSDNDEKMTDKSVLLEASRAGGGGVRIPLDLSHCPSYALFPGQLVCLEGKNPDGSAFIVSSQKEHPCLIGKVTSSGVAGGPTSILVASGPYSLDMGTLDFSPLDRLLHLAVERRPALLILMGPFIDAENGAVKSGNIAQMPDELFKTVVLAKLTTFSQRCPETRIAIVPSLSDLSHDYIYPQCAISQLLISDPKILLVANPGIILLDDISIAVSSPDSLLRLGLTEICRNPAITDRFSRLSSHLLAQSSFYPTIPAQEGVNIDFNHLESIEFPHQPDILISPSALRHFAKPVLQSVVVNPGQFCRKQALGSAALLTLQPAPNTPITESTRVDIIQF